jgi:hypothetical protein
MEILLSYDEILALLEHLNAVPLNAMSEDVQRLRQRLELSFLDQQDSHMGPGIQAYRTPESTPPPQAYINGE